LFNEDLTSNQVPYFATIRMIITSKIIKATKAFILHPHHQPPHLPLKLFGFVAKSS
jgi:hypothetical protein